MTRARGHIRGDSGRELSRQLPARCKHCVLASRKGRSASRTAWTGPVPRFLQNAARPVATTVSPPDHQRIRVGGHYAATPSRATGAPHSRRGGLDDTAHAAPPHPAGTTREGEAQHPAAPPARRGDAEASTISGTRAVRFAASGAAVGTAFPIIVSSSCHHRSIINVTGPSLTSDTFIAAPNSAGLHPVAA